jgi:hypothetical protein
MVGERLNPQALGVVLRATFVPRITTNFENLPAVPCAACVAAPTNLHFLAASFFVALNVSMIMRESINR